MRGPAFRSATPIRAWDAAGEPFRILILDGEPMVRAGISQSLRRLGYEVLETGAWSVALDGVEAWRPHLVLLDIETAGAEDPAATATLRRMSPDLRIVVLAGRRATRPVDLPGIAAEAGADAALAKPFARRDIVAIAALCLGERR